MRRSVSPWGGETLCAQTQSIPAGRMIPHPRTLRKARLQVKLMVNSGVSLRQAKRYLKQWLLWWTKTVDEWQPTDILQAFIDACRPHAVIERVIALAIQHQFTGLHSVADGVAWLRSA